MKKIRVFFYDTEKQEMIADDRISVVPKIGETIHLLDDNIIGDVTRVTHNLSKGKDGVIYIYMKCLIQ